MKRIVSLLLCLMMLLCAMPTSGLAADSQNTFTWWISRQEDSTYYAGYEENPSLQYLLSRNTYEGSALDLKFWAGISGSEKDNFTTMISTGEVSDVLDMAFSPYNAAALYEERITLDLTELAEQYMPNFWNYIHTDPYASQSAWSYIDGEKRLLSITGYQDARPDIFEGYLYRRDWIAKYGKNPVTGEAFTYSVADDGTWTDDVLFPCGETDPYYISDWEWMFGIFTEAMAAEGIVDGYCFSIFYQGYMQTGDLYSMFGGGKPLWHVDADGNAAFGANTDTMRTYLECASAWYQKGWIDKSFYQRSSDMFYIIDSTSVHQGKVGLWQGRQTEVGAAMDLQDGGLTDGIMVYGCPQPINDLYGDDAHQNLVPNAFFALTRELGSVVITTGAAKKNLPALLAFMDSLYVGEGSYARTGLTKAQLDASAPDAPWVKINQRFGLDNGLYTLEDVDGVEVLRYTLNDSLLKNVFLLNRISIGLSHTLNADNDYAPLVQRALDLWQMYDNTSEFSTAVDLIISPDDYLRIQKTESNLVTFLSQNVPKFVMGQKDAANDAEWESFVKALNKYAPDKVTKIYQDALDMLK